MGHYFITGASSGIGKALSIALASEGHVVSAVARRIEHLKKIKGKHKNINIFRADVCDRLEIKNVIEKSIKSGGNIDCAVLNAGKYLPLGGLELNSEEFYGHMMVNYMGVIHSLDSIIPKFIGLQRGHIVIMGSTAGYGGLPRSAAYGPTKAALSNLAEALHIDLTPLGIKVQIISPGFVETEATAINDFKMPQIISASKAANNIIKGLKSNKFEICFPTGFVIIMKLLRILPKSIYFKVIRWITNR